MKPFEHINAATTHEAASLLRKYQGKARVIAGGTDLIGVLKDNIHAAYPEAVINIKTIPGLDGIKADAKGLKIGALAKLADIGDSAVVKEKYAALSQAARSAALPQIRNMGTIGGNLCQENRCLYYRYPHQLGGRVVCLRKGGSTCYTVAGDNRYDSIFGAPKGCYAVSLSDLAPALIALGATAVTTKKKVPLESFFTDLPGNVLAADEILTEIDVPALGANTKSAYLKFRQRKAIDFAIVSAACALTVEGGICKDARIVLGGVAPIPWRATAAEEAIKGRKVDTASAEAAGKAAVAKADPRPMAKYKVPLAEVFVKRAILACV